MSTSQFPPIIDPSQSQATQRVPRNQWRTETYSRFFKEKYGVITICRNKWALIISHPVDRDVLPSFGMDFVELQRQIGFLRFCEFVDKAKDSEKLVG
jgi:hypothetical protein